MNDIRLFSFFPPVSLHSFNGWIFMNIKMISNPQPLSRVDSFLYAFRCRRRRSQFHQHLRFTSMNKNWKLYIKINKSHDVCSHFLPSQLFSLQTFVIRLNVYQAEVRETIIQQNHNTFSSSERNLSCDTSASAFLLLCPFTWQPSIVIINSIHDRNYTQTSAPNIWH